MLAPTRGRLLLESVGVTESASDDFLYALVVR